MTVPGMLSRPLAAWRRRPRPFAWMKRFLPRTLFGRSLMIIATPVVLAQAIATFVFYDRHWDTMTNRLAFAVAGEIAIIVDELLEDRSEEERASTMARAAGAVDLFVSWLPGETLPPGRQELRGILKTTLGRALDERVRRPWRIDSTVAHEWIEIRIQMDEGVLSVMSPERRLFSFTSYLFIMWMIGSSVVLFAIAIVFMRNQIRPIRRLAVVADAFGKGRDAPGFKPEGALEVRQAAAAFLLMRERIQRMISQRTEMLAGVSHDLRTPLTRMKLELAMLPDLPEVAELRQDVADMETMIEGYLAFARGEGAEAPQPVDIARLLEAVAANARREGAAVTLDLPAETAGEDGGKDEGADGEAGIILPIRPNAFKRCLANLVGNARRYGSHVWIGLRRDATAVEIVIDDDGPGIPPDRREEVFRPFTRLEPSRNAETGGVGLGMTIARDVARRHGGDVVLGDSPHGGLRAIVRLPV
ncbi:ATP-binding protein [Rhodospirillum centenum]|uniref:histidine kinase n=1 Tax=Rhodospirillum centenum (strain ATCC 51521 / SW) TaxID=414684 RepID=B6ITI9_RHOCS|nr:ATP-binding protein [Rhodospirillum centenum]ACI99290.1 sensor histidine kinase, putative [Rhodospirillum centenum SW]